MTKPKVIDSYKLMQGIEKYVIGGAIAGLTGVQWHDDQTSAFTDGSTIHLPRPNSLMTEEELLLWRYKAEHELGHEDAINSCPHWREVMMEKRKQKEYKEDGMLWWIANLISDHVQERNRVGELIGRDEVLLKGRQAFLETLVYPQLNDPATKGNPEAHISSGLFKWDTETRKNWNINIGAFPSVEKKVDDVVQLIREKGGVDLATLKNEKDVFDAALKLRKLFPEIPQDNNFANGKPQDGEGDGDASPGEEGKGKKGNKKSAKAIDFIPNGKHVVDPKAKRNYSYSDKGDVYAPRLPIPLSKSSRAGHGKAYASSHISAVSSLIRKTNLPAKVRGYLMAMKREKYTTGWRSGRLDTNRLADVLHGKEDLFRRKEPVRLVDSAVYLLVDSSGSMSGQPFEQACAAALMMGEALQGINVNVEIAGFTEYSGRKDGLIHDTWLSFGHRFAKPAILDKMGLMRGCLSNNADGENILYAYNRLKQQKQTRKILIVLSDGEPAASGPEGATMDIGRYTKQVCEMIEKDKDVVLIGLGMSGYKPSRFYKNAIGVEHGQPLEPTLLEIVKNGVLK